MTKKDLRTEIVEAYQELDKLGMNKGSSGNVSARDGTNMLITPSGIPAMEMNPEQVCALSLEDDSGAYGDQSKPSSEWRFHSAILQSRPDINAVVHTHAPFSTILSILRKPIPAVHYMMAAFGTTELKVADYHTYGTEELSKAVLSAMEGCAGCLMANHGMVVGGPSLYQAMWLADQFELLASQYYHSMLAGTPHVLTDEEIADTVASFADYGPKDPQV